MTDYSEAEERAESQATGDGSAFDSWLAAIRRALHRADEGYADLYVRSMLPPAGAKAPQVTCFERLEGISEETPIEDVRVNVWGERICLCEVCQRTSTGRAMVDTVRELESWGDEFDATAAPFFERRHVESTITGETHDSVVPPRITVALYLDGSLSAVFPCRIGSENYGISDLCSVLEEVRDADVDPVEQRQ